VDKSITNLSPDLSVDYSLNKQNGGRISVFTHEIEDENIVMNLNKNMLGGCNKFVVFYQKSDFEIV